MGRIVSGACNEKYFGEVTTSTKDVRKNSVEDVLFGILSSVFDHMQNLGPSLCPYLCEGSIFILCSDNPVLSMEEYIRHL